MIDPDQRRKEQFSRLRLLGALLIALALSASAFSYFFIQPQDREAYYMMSAIFGLMGLVCVGTLKK